MSWLGSAGVTTITSYLCVGVCGVPLHQLAEGVGVLGAEHVHGDEHPVVHNGRVLSQEAIKPQLITTQ